WKEIQTNTFVNWANIHMQDRNLGIENLEEDMKDGVRLCALVEVLQNKKIVGKVVQNPKNSHQSLQNATVALTAVANDNVKLVNIGK
ncbi:hypothetical protein LOTGIDRAFT_89490, partial [Lottia gigantea]